MKEFWTIFQQGVAVGRCTEHLKITGTALCPLCFEEYKKVGKYEWKHACKKLAGKETGMYLLSKGGTKNGGSRNFKSGISKAQKVLQ